jgi:hypothetical protein
MLYFEGHLDTKVYCIYLWDKDSGLFRYEPGKVPAINPVPHPENKTITAHQDWSGGAWKESTYRWKGSETELIEQDTLYGDGSTQTDKDCGFTFTCSRLINGKMVTTLEKPICTQEEMDNLPECPDAAAPPEPNAITTKPTIEKKD